MRAFISHIIWSIAEVRSCKRWLLQSYFSNYVTNLHVGNCYKRASDPYNMSGNIGISNSVIISIMENDFKDDFTLIVQRYIICGSLLAKIWATLWVYALNRPEVITKRVNFKFLRKLEFWPRYAEIKAALR